MTNERRYNHKAFRHYVGKSAVHVGYAMKQYIQKHKERIDPHSEAFSPLLLVSTFFFIFTFFFYSFFSLLLYFGIEVKIGILFLGICLLFM